MLRILIFITLCILFLSCRCDDWIGFERIEVVSSVDAEKQFAYARRSVGDLTKPLVVSLHVWNGNYERPDPLAELVAEQDWNYIHPDFRGSNRTPASCASELALSDIDDAIRYCIENWNVDTSRIYVVGASGGGHAACAYFLTSEHQLRAVYAWVPIVDIAAWYRQSKQRGLSFAKDIELVCGGEFSAAVAKQRSPLYMGKAGTGGGRLHLFAGIEDGYEGSVPISHSLLMYNRLCDESDEMEKALDLSQMLALVTKDVVPVGQLGGTGRALYFSQSCALGSLSIFEGEHEILHQETMQMMLRDYRQSPATD